MEIAGISQKLEDLSPAVDIHITRYVNRIEAATPIIEVSSRSSKDAGVEAAQRVENFYYAFLSESMRQRPGGILSPYRRHIDDMTSKGAGFLHLVLNPKVRAELTGDLNDVEAMVAAAKKAFSDGFKENPFLVECPQLETIYFPNDLREIAEIGVRAVSAVLTSYDGLDYKREVGFEWLTGDTMREYQSDWNDTITYYHLETSGFIYDLLDEANDREPFLLERRPNVTERPWYTIAPGHVNNHPSPDKRFQPLIAGVYPTVQIMNVTRTLLQSGALNTGRPMYQEVADGRSGPDLMGILNQPAEQRPIIHFDPSEQVLKKPRKGYHWEVVPTPSPEWLQIANEQSQRDLRDWGFPVGLSPDAPTSADASSGIQAAHQMEVAVNYLDPALGNVARSLRELLIQLGDAIKGFGLPVTIPVRKRAEGGDMRVRETVTVRPDDFQEQDIEVRLESIPATARQAIKEDERRDMQLGLMSRRTWLRRRYDDYIAEEKRILIDKAYVFAEEKALETVKRFIAQNSDAIAAKVAAEQGIPPTPLIPQDGGPAPGEEARFARPDVPVQGTGTPNPIPDQNPGATIGTAQQVQV